MFNQIKT